MQRSGVAPLTPLMGTLIQVRNQSRHDLSVDCQLRGDHLLVIIADKNDLAVEVLRETELIQPSVSVTRWIEERGRHGS